MYTIVFPALVVWWMKRVGAVSDIFVRERKERTALYVATIILYFAWFYSLWRLARMSHMAVAATLAIVVINILVMLINLRWKVSAHAAACGGVVGVLTAISYLLYFNPVWLVCLSLVYSLLVMLARLILDEHTPLQLIVGFYVGVGGAWMAYVISYTFLFA
ncbi:MAG: phosphatase PAP2 family protein [Paludibacteraceae bacterium]|nr:phosphatase PAP2 family protein [Paludibacteraceae bacterium]